MRWNNDVRAWVEDKCITLCGHKIHGDFVDFRNKFYADLNYADFENINEFVRQIYRLYPEKNNRYYGFLFRHDDVNKKVYMTLNFNNSKYFTSKDLESEV